MYAATIGVTNFKPHSASTVALVLFSQRSAAVVRHRTNGGVVYLNVVLSTLEHCLE